MAQNPCLDVLYPVARRFGIGGKTPVTSEQTLSISNELERERGKRHNRGDEADEADVKFPALVDPNENRHYAVAEEDKPVDTSGDDGHDRINPNGTEDEPRDKQCPGDEFGQRENAKQPSWSHCVMLPNVRLSSGQAAQTPLSLCNGQFEKYSRMRHCQTLGLLKVIWRSSSVSTRITISAVEAITQ